MPPFQGFYLPVSPGYFFVDECGWSGNLTIMFPRRVKFLCLVVPAVAGLASGALAAESDDAEGFGPEEVILWREVLDEQARNTIQPTEAVAIERLIMPWETTRAVVIVFPLKDLARYPAAYRIVRDLLQVLLPRMEVIGLYHERDYRLLGDLLQALEREPGIKAHFNRLTPLSSEVFSIWARDFSPFYARGTDGQLVALDSSFVPPRRFANLLDAAREEENPVARLHQLRNATLELRDMRGSDVVPGVLNAFIESHWQVPTALSRPPIYLLGGDLLPVSPKAALTSGLTLMENGGRTGAMNAALRDYYGLEQVLYLENLPGDTIEHLDFMVQPIGAETILVAAPPPDFGSDRPYHRELKRELLGRLANNKRVLKEHFPDHRIIEVPMPPPILQGDAAVEEELFLNCLGEFASREGLSVWDSPNPRSPESLNPRLVAALGEKAGLRDINDRQQRREFVSSFLGRPIEQLIARHVEEHVIFRSYVNSLYLKAPDGSEMVLVPRYRAVIPSEEKMLGEMEKQVAAAYKEALPEAELHWIDITELSGFLGAVHCLTATIPE